ncbi:MAG TPA: M15 family metallopeptidase [Streptomyces sp.]|jgi:D-alanyl-D-alanine dipeptidase|nr:M15 family metallopeptidase [Streptomyces sp.]
MDNVNIPGERPDAGRPGTPREIVLISDPRVAAVPIHECGEPLLDSQGLLRVDHRRSDPGGDWRHLRAGLLGRLQDAQQVLPDGWHWLLVEGYRPPALQRSIFDGYASRLRTLRPQDGEAKIRADTARWCAPLETAGHIAGAALDLTVCTDDGSEVDMGCPEASTPEESSGACYTHAPGLPEEVSANRAVMIEALTAAGLVNYPTEWWHWSYGDRYWAWTTGAPAAVYGPYSRVGASAGDADVEHGGR